MKLQRIRLTVEDLVSIPQNERALLISLAFAINEITMLNKLVAIGSHFSNGPQWVVQAELAQASILARVVFGKLNEFWALVQDGYLKSKVASRYGNILPESARDALAALKRHFGRKSLTNMVRNTLAFHYSLEHVATDIPRDLPGEELAIYLHPMIGNSLYQFAELLMSASLYEKIAPSDPEKAAQVYFDELSTVVRYASDFGHGLIVELFAQNLGMARLQAAMDTVDVPHAPNYAELSLPFFIEMPSPEALHGA